jgi:hypothetical protein
LTAAAAGCIEEFQGEGDDSRTPGEPDLSFTSPNLLATRRIALLPSALWLAGAVWGPQFTPGAAISWLELAACLSQAVVLPPMFAVTRTRRSCNQKSVLKLQAATASASLLRSGS